MFKAFKLFDRFARFGRMSQLSQCCGRRDLGSFFTGSDEGDPDPKALVMFLQDGRRRHIGTEEFLELGGECLMFLFWNLQTRDHRLRGLSRYER